MHDTKSMNIVSLQHGKGYEDGARKEMQRVAKIKIKLTDVDY